MADRCKGVQIEISQDGNPPETKNVSVSGICLNAAGGDGAVAGGAGHVYYALIAASAWAREMVSCAADDLLQFRLGIGNLVPQTLLVEIGQIGMSHRVAADFEAL